MNLGSDHRAVRTVFELPRSCEAQRTRRKQSYGHIDWNRFSANLGTTLASSERVTSIPCLEETMKEVALKSRHPCLRPASKPQTELQRLCRLRRQSQNAENRKDVSKLIWRESRRELRTLRTQQVTKILQEFRGLSRLEAINANQSSMQTSIKATHINANQSRKPPMSEPSSST